MSTHRKVWYESIRANQLIQQDLETGEKLFHELLVQNPSDGMIYYERAEAYETLDYLDAALDNYSSATRLFPLDNWKEVAKLGVDRISRKKSYSFINDQNDQWNVFHKVHSLNRLDHKIRCQALSSLSRFDVEIEACLSDFRCILEEIVNVICQHANHNFDRNTILSKKIKWLGENKSITNRAYNIMRNINKWGNDTIHDKGVDENVRIEAYLGNFYELLVYMNNFEL